MEISMSVSEAERFANDLNTRPELRSGMNRHADSVADIVAFAASRGYSFTVEEAKHYPAITDALALDHAQLDAVAGGAIDYKEGGNA
jgi:predicted ribosomally synthesized peptide with nif11-like leader